MYSVTQPKIEHPDTAMFKAWVRTAKTGETYIYYSGHLAEARMELTTIPNPKAKTLDLPPGVERSYDWSKHSYLYFARREPLDSYARTVWEAYERGDVLLTQKRRPDGTFDYRATRTRRRK
jgi:hypothetical protein